MNNQIISLQVVDLKTFYEKLVVDLIFFTKRIASYYNRYCNIEPIFKKKDKVYLIQRNIQTKQPNTKLDHKKLGLFKIKKVIGLVNYKLVLPKTINIYPVFWPAKSNSHLSVVLATNLRLQYYRRANRRQAYIAGAGEVIVR
jgi:hypothetical protein